MGTPVVLTTYTPLTCETRSISLTRKDVGPEGGEVAQEQVEARCISAKGDGGRAAGGGGRDLCNHARAGAAGGEEERQAHLLKGKAWHSILEDERQDPARPIFVPKLQLCEKRGAGGGGEGEGGEGATLAEVGAKDAACSADIAGQQVLSFGVGATLLVLVVSYSLLLPHPSCLFCFLWVLEPHFSCARPLGLACCYPPPPFCLSV